MLFSLLAILVRFERVGLDVVYTVVGVTSSAVRSAKEAKFATNRIVPLAF